MADDAAPSSSPARPAEPVNAMDAAPDTAADDVDAAPSSPANSAEPAAHVMADALEAAAVDGTVVAAEPAADAMDAAPDTAADEADAAPSSPANAAEPAAHVMADAPEAAADDGAVVAGELAEPAADAMADAPEAAPSYAHLPGFHQLQPARAHAPVSPPRAPSPPHRAVASALWANLPFEMPASKRSRWGDGGSVPALLPPPGPPPIPPMGMLPRPPFAPPIGMPPPLPFAPPPFAPPPAGGLFYGALPPGPSLSVIWGGQAVSPFAPHPGMQILPPVLPPQWPPGLPPMQHGPPMHNGLQAPPPSQSFPPFPGGSSGHDRQGSLDGGGAPHFTDSGPVELGDNGGDGGAGMEDEHELEFKRWKNAIVEFARPFLNRPFAAKLISRDEFKTILKKGYRAKHNRPPAKCAIPDSTAASIKRLVDEYVAWQKKQWT
ncbi:hypothetical protein T492DRAFT_876456 [Pavlovales sp. CCMP2436]|nr:hypothetical protein T492DRAFT_876456 [Pavlovales sp. CCMP2436]